MVAGVRQTWRRSDQAAKTAAKASGQEYERAKHAGLGDVAQPFDSDGAGTVGQPMQANDNGEHDEQEQDEADHRFSSVPAPGSERAASDDLRAASSWPMDWSTA